jgi:hypothetical protein
MSKGAAQLLEAFDALSEEEKRRFTALFLRRTIPSDWGHGAGEHAFRVTDDLLAEFGGREYVEQRIREGIAQLDRGEGIPEEELDAYLARRKAQLE